MPKMIGQKNSTPQGEDSLEKRDKFYVARRQFSRTYYILSDTLNDTEDDIANTVGLPSLFQPLLGGFCKSRKFKETTRIATHPNTGVECALWEVTCEFDSDVDIDQNEDPEAKPPKIRWTGDTTDEVLEKDPISLKPIQTDNDEPLFLTSPVVCPVLEIKRYESYPFDPDVILDYCHHTNSEVFWGAPEGSALMLPMDVDEELITEGETSIRYAVVTYRIKFKIKKEAGQMVEDTWKARVLHHGFKVRKTAGGPVEVYGDRKENPATVNLITIENDPVNFGMKVPDGDPAQFKEFNQFPKADFNNLSLGPFA